MPTAKSTPLTTLLIIAKGNQLYTCILLFILFLSTACSPKETHHLDFDSELYTPQSSKGFSIRGNDESENILISSLNPWQGASDVTSELLIQKDNTLPLNFKGQILKEPPERIVCMSSTHIAMLDALEETDKIVGVSGAEYITNPYIRANFEKIPDIGYEGNIDYEKLIATQPDLILMFSVNGASSMEPKLKELGIPFFYVGDYVEEDPMGKAEWIVPLAEILGKRQKGVEIFNDINSRYNKLKEKVDSASLPAPKVMVNAPFLDSWFMPSSESYVARMIKDAGGEFIYGKNTGNASYPIDMEEALKLVSEADFWINISDLKSFNELKKQLPRFANAECVVKGNVYNNNKILSPGGGNDCFESGVVNPDLILRDLIKIFHPQLIEEDFTYYHHLQ